MTTTEAALRDALAIVSQISRTDFPGRSIAERHRNADTALSGIAQALSQPSPASSTAGEVRIAVLRAHEHDSIMAPWDYKFLILPEGKSEDFDEDDATRRWLWPHLGSTHHLVGFTSATLLSPSSGEPASVAEQGNVNLSHEAAIKALCDCAATVTVLSYQEVIEGYFSLRGLPIPGVVA